MSQKIKKKIDCLQNKIAILRDKIYELRDKEFAKNKIFVGRCFKYRNRDSCDSWWLYFKILSITNSEFNIFSFQRCSGDKWIIEPKHPWNLQMVETSNEITEKEFMEHWNLAKKEINSYLE